MKRIYLTVTNDLVYDQRMIRICRSLAANGYSVVLVGRKLPRSKPLRDEPFEQIRLSCLFGSGKFFYTEYHLRLFFFLLFRKMDGLCAIDLDTILPCLWVSRLKKIPRIYDAHELFSEMKEVITRPAIRNFWIKVERYAVPQYANGYTVSRSIADEFRKRYGVDYGVIRNVPVLEDPATAATAARRDSTAAHDPVAARDPAANHDLPEGRFILYQGAVNEARGLESLIAAMREVDCPLIICGEGNRMEECRKLTEEYGLSGKVIFSGLIEPAVLREITKKAYIGINLVERLGLNQYYSLANKFFDYIHAGVPQVTMDFPEYRLIRDRFPIGSLIPDTEEKKIAEALNNLLKNDVLYAMFKENCRQARQMYNWQEEEKGLLRFYQKIFG